MKKALLIFLMLLLPWQSLIAAERNFTHLMSRAPGHGLELVAKHIAEHSANIPHHHDDDDDDGDAHVDNSQKSFRHLTDFEHGSGINLLWPAPVDLPLALDIRVPPTMSSDIYSDRTTLPLLRPPRSLA